MPSGPKKRKAAKKKKGNQPNDHSNPASASAQSHGDDVEHPDDKEGDAGDGSYLVSEDHQNILKEGEVEKSRGANIVVEDDTAIQIEREFNIEDEPDKRNGTIAHDEQSRKHCDEADLLSEKPTGAIHSATIEEAGESVSKDYGEKNLVSVEDKFHISAAFLDAAPGEQEEQTITQSVARTEFMEPDTDNRLTQSDNAPPASGDLVTEYEKKSGVAEPRLAPVERTSWKSCCGLCELFIGSGS